MKNMFQIKPKLRRVSMSILTVDVFGCYCSLPLGPAIDIGGIPGSPGPPGPPGPGPSLLFGGRSLIPGPYEPGSTGHIPWPLDLPVL